MNTVRFFVAMLAFPALAARPAFTPNDLWEWRSASDPQISSDGQSVVYVEEWKDRAANKARANLWVVSSDGRVRRRLTEGAWRDRSPRWSPDGTRLAWLSDRDGTPQIYWRRLESGPDTQLAKLEEPPSSLAWSPNGESIAYTAPVIARAPPPAWAPPAILPRLRRRKEDFLQLFVISAAGGKPRQVSTGELALTGEPSWMPDGQSLVISRDDGQICAYRVTGGAPRQLTREPARNENQVVSPDGAKIAWLSTPASNQSYATRKLYVMNSDGSRVKILSGSLDRDATSPQWSPDSRTVYFLADDRGATYAYAARNDGTIRQSTTAAGRLRGFSLADNGRAVSIRHTVSEAGNVFTFTVDRVSQPATLAAPNEQLLAEREIGGTEEMHYESAGQTVQAWIVKPPGFDAARKYPLLLDIHDDPRSMWGADFSLRAQIAAARGFVVLCANPRGTPGYGELFGNLLHTGLPGDDYDDLMRGVDAVVAKGSIDPKRLTLTGGLLAAWTIGHTDRFRAAVACRPITDWVTDVALAPDGLRRALTWMGAMPWDDPDQYVKRSPIFFARNFRTPTLVLAGDPDPEAEELYFALQARKVESAFIRLPAAPTPADEILELETILAWLAKHTAP